MEITLQRALTLARGIQVTVNSWNTFQQVAFSESAFGTLNGSLSGGSAADTQPVQQYVLIRPNLTRDTAQAIARQRLSELSRHERTITLTMPGELTLTPRSTIMLNGTGTDFDQAYYIDSIERTFRTRTGFVQHMRASNSSPRAISVSNSA
jgi:hypothetical protein